MVAAKRLFSLAVLWLYLLSLAPQGWGEEARVFYAEDIKAAMAEHIAARVDEAGRFSLVDDETGERLTLRFVKIHDPVREFEDRRYFACTDFAVEGAPEQLYDLDFWLVPNGERLKVVEERVHKEPREAPIFGWYKYPRYTFVDDEVRLLYPEEREAAAARERAGEGSDL
jgi:hypothetical protein